MKPLFSWLDRLLRPKTTDAVERLAEVTTAAATHRAESQATFEQQTADYTAQIEEAKRLIACGETPPSGVRQAEAHG